MQSRSQTDQRRKRELMELFPTQFIYQWTFVLGARTKTNSEELAEVQITIYYILGTAFNEKNTFAANGNPRSAVRTQ